MIAAVAARRPLAAAVLARPAPPQFARPRVFAPRRTRHPNFQEGLGAELKQPSGSGWGAGRLGKAIREGRG